MSRSLSRLLRWLAGGRPLLEITWCAQAEHSSVALADLGSYPLPHGSNRHPDVLFCDDCGIAYQARPWEHTVPEWRCRACAEKAEQVAA